MYSPKELRLGNIFINKSANAYLRVDEISEKGVVFHVLDRGKYPLSTGDNEPILLTEEVLLKCGFEKGLTMNMKLSDIQDMECAILIADNVCDVNIIGKHYRLLFNHIQYLHQLQNLLFLITGKELKVNI